MKKSIVYTARIAALLLIAQLNPVSVMMAQYVAQFSDSTHFMFRFADAATSTQIDSLKTEFNATELAILPITQVRLWFIPDSIVAQYGGPLGIRNHGVGKTYVISSDPNYKTGGPSGQEGGSGGSGSGFPGCSGLDIHCPFGENKITVSIHDTGYDGAPVNPANHTIFQNSIWENTPETSSGASFGADDDGNTYTDDQNGWNFTIDTPSPLDQHDHGTHVTGIAAQILQINNTSSVDLMPLQALDQTGSGNLWDLVRSVDYALEKNVRVMNMSIAYIGVASPTPSVLEWVFDFAKTYIPGGTLFVVAAGNDGIDLDTVSGAFRYFPAQFNSENMIVVAAEDCTGNMPSFSNRGVNTVDIAAPGIDIYSTITNNNFTYMSGTSMSAPFVATAAARYGTNMPVFDWNVVKNAVINNSSTRAGLINKVALGKSLRFCGPSLMPKHQNTPVGVAFSDDIRISPNPTSGFFTVAPEEVFPVASTVTVYNAVGQIIHQEIMPAFTSGIQIAGNTWPAGFYQVEVRNTTTRHTQVLIKS